MPRNRGLSLDEVFPIIDDKREPWDGLDPATKAGHVHLHVANLDANYRFYHDVLSFGLPFEPMDTAVFFSAGSYHHHIGTNVWQGAGVLPAPPDAIGLRYFTVILPDSAALQEVVERVGAAGIETEQTERGLLLHDPAHNGLLLTDHA
jgi:catechol 2,3-dioxygenase